MNLFIRELQAVLERHGYPLTILYSVREEDGSPAISAAKISRLLRSQFEAVTAMLNAEEITAVVHALALDPRDGQRLRGAVTGEAIRQLLSGRISAMSAYDEGERILKLLLEEEVDAEHLRDDARKVEHSQLSANLLPGTDKNAVVAEALESAAESCERGELWLGVALATPDRDRREDFLKMAQAALNRAAQFLAVAPIIAQGSPAQEEWRRIIEQALTTLRQATAL